MADRSHFFAQADGLDSRLLLDDWRWLVGDEAYELLAVAAIGNLFLTDHAGVVYLLEVTDGSFRQIAASEGDFRERLEDRGNRRAWLLSFLVRELRKRGQFLEPGLCYSWKIPPHLGGSCELDNLETTDIAVHVSLLGQLHRQTRGLPPGTVIRQVRFVEPKPRSLWTRLLRWGRPR